MLEHSFDEVLAPDIGIKGGERKRIVAIPFPSHPNRAHESAQRVVGRAGGVLPCPIANRVGARRKLSRVGACFGRIRH